MSHHTHPATDAHPSPPPAPEHATAAPRRSWTVLVVALVAQALVVLDITVVNTALPTIGASLGLPSSDLQALVTAYLMMSGGALLLGGRIADLLDRRRVFLGGLTVFTVASVLSAFATTGTELTITRALQGLSAALLTPAALSIVVTTYAGDQRKRGLILWGAVGSIGVAAGVLVGGALTTWFGWQSIFFINGPIGVVLFVIALVAVPRNSVSRTGLARFDLPGAITLLGGLMTLMFTLSGTETYGWTALRTVAGFAATAGLLAAFATIESRTAAPLIPAHTWRIPSLVSGTTVMLGVSGILVGTVFLASIFVQRVLGLSALAAGLGFVPFALAITAGTQIARHLLARMSPRSVATSGLIVTSAAALYLSTVGTGAHYVTTLLPGMVVLGLGVGMVFAPVSVSAMSGIPPQHSGTASGFLMTGHEIGAALGVAVISAVAATAGSLASAEGVAAGFRPGFLAAAAIAAGMAVIAYRRMPRETLAIGRGGMHHH